MARKSLRPHQDKALKLLRLAIAMGRKRPFLQASCGFGKTVVASAMIHSALSRGKRAIFVVPSLSLIDQTVARLAEDGIVEVGVIQADHPKTDPDQPIQIASVQTLLNRSLSGRVERALRRRSVGLRDEAGRVVYEDKIQDDGSIKRVMVRQTVEKNVDLNPIPIVDLVIIDEAHHTFDLYAEWMNHPLWLNVPFVGLSATPWTKGLGLLYNDLIKPISMQELIDLGFLSPFRVFAPSHPDLSKVRTVAGDYHEGDLEEAMNTKGLVADIVESWLKHGSDLPTVCFGVNRVHAQTIQAQFVAAGIPASYADAFTGREERQEILEKFRSGEIKIICNVDVYSKGFDEDVRCIIMARPSKSEMWFVQAIGRGLRTAPGKQVCTILDHSDNHLRLGFVTDIDYDELDDGTKAKKDKKQADVEERLPKECPSCSALRPPAMKRCPACGFEPKPKSDITCEDGELVELKPKGKKVRAFTQAEKQSFYSMALGLQMERSKKDGYAAHLYREKFQVWPRGMVEFPLPPNDEVRNFVTHRNMKRAFGRTKARA